MSNTLSIRKSCKFVYNRLQKRRKSQFECIFRLRNLSHNLIYKWNDIIAKLLAIFRSFEYEIRRRGR